jgi:hypothetical protein
VFNTVTIYLFNFTSLINAVLGSFYSLLFITYNLLTTSVFKSLLVSFSTNFTNLYSNLGVHTNFTGVLNSSKSINASFSSKSIIAGELTNSFSFLEHSGASHRALRFSNALIGYDYKTGHYLGSSEKFYPHLVLSFIEVARGIRKPS